MTSAAAPPRRLFAAAPLALVMLLNACGEDATAPPPAPVGPAPAPVTDLVVVGGRAGEMDLAWTSPAPPAGQSGPIAYELRHCTPGDEDAPFETWPTAAAPAMDEAGGALHHHNLTGLAEGAAYVLRLRARAGDGPWSAPSNIVIGTAATDHDRTPPARVAAARQWAGNAASVTVAWAAAGDDSIYGAATDYEVRWHAAETDWAAMTPAAGEVSSASKPGWLQTSIGGLTADETVHVRVAARDEAGNTGAPSAAAQLTAAAMRVWYVDVEGTGDAPTINAAVQAAGPGDLVLIAPGRYTWSRQGTGHPQYGLVHVPADHVGFTIRGEAGPEATIIDAERLGRVMVITGATLGPGEDLETWPGVTVEGLTLTNGVALSTVQGPDEAYAGAGLTFHLSNAVIRNCIITGNESTVGGGLWFGGQGVPVIEDCVISDNISHSYGGGIMLMKDAYPITVRNTVLSGNRAEYGGGLAAFHTLVIMENVTVTGNSCTRQGGGVYVLDTHPGSVMRGCTVAGNYGLTGSALRIDDGADLELERCLLAGNAGSPGILAASGTRLTASCSNLWGHPMGNNWPSQTVDAGGLFQADPLFCGDGSYELREGSPCLPGGHPGGDGCGLVGARGQGCP